MTLSEIIKIAVDQGITFAIAILVIGILAVILINLPKWIPQYLENQKRNAIAQENMTRAMESMDITNNRVIDVIQNTEEMHDKLDEKLDVQHELVINKMEDIIERIVSLLEMSSQNKDADSDFKYVVLKQITQLIDEFEKLNSDLKRLKDVK